MKNKLVGGLYVKMQWCKILNIQKKRTHGSFSFPLKSYSEQQTASALVLRLNSTAVALAKLDFGSSLCKSELSDLRKVTCSLAKHFLQFLSLTKDVMTNTTHFPLKKKKKKAARSLVEENAMDISGKAECQVPSTECQH